jgi:hypothetical protein
MKLMKKLSVTMLFFSQFTILHAMEPAGRPVWNNEASAPVVARPVISPAIRHGSLVLTRDNLREVLSSLTAGDFAHVINLEVRTPGIPLAELQLDRFVNLKRLNLSCNRLRSLEGLPATMNNLEDLDLSDNRLRSLEGLPATMNNFMELDLSGNQLTSLRGFPATMNNLRNLHVSDNPLISLEGLPATMNHLVRLNLLYTQFRSFQDITRNRMPELVIFHIDRLPAAEFQRLRSLEMAVVAS